jgi:hypothetical protein
MAGKSPKRPAYRSKSTEYSRALCGYCLLLSPTGGRKILRAYLVWQEIEFPRTHALEDLVLLASQKEPDFLGLEEEAASLTPYAVETRYPEFEEPSVEDARESIEIARKVAHFVLQRLPQEARGGADAGSIMGF